MLFQLDSSLPFASRVNAEIAPAQRMSFAAHYREAVVAFAGDPQDGTMLANTSIEANSATQVQRYISQFYSESGMVQPDDIQKILEQNMGPSDPWNYSWADFGLIPGKPSKIQVVNALRKSDGLEMEVVLIP